MAFTEKQIQKIRLTSIAHKYSCSHVYVGMILRGERDVKSEKAKAILKDAKRILKIVESEI